MRVLTRFVFIGSLVLGAAALWLWSGRPGGQPVAGGTPRAAQLPTQDKQPAAHAALQALPSQEQESLWHAVGEARRAVVPITPQEAEMLQNEGAYFFTQNPGQRLTARFLAGAVRLQSGIGGDWAGTLGVAAQAGPVPRMNGTRVEYHHASGMVEWYENRPEGLEHAFQVPARPQAGAAASPLRVPMKLEGLSVAPVTPEGTLRFADPATGTEVLGYGKLRVWDAQGQELAAWYETAPQGGGFDIVVADAGAAYPLTIDPLITSLVAKLTSPIPDVEQKAGDNYGVSVSLSESLLAVGASGDDTAAGANAGSVYVYTRNSSVWLLEAKLTAADGAANDGFGRAVAVAGDTLLAGASGHDLPSATNAGSAYVFTRSGTTWTQQAKLTAADAAASDNFGFSVALEGDTAVAGAFNDDTSAGVDAGSAYVFTRSGTTWAQQARLTASNAAAGNVFGVSVAISGETVLVGAYLAESGTGSAYAFTRTGTTWTQQARLIAADRATGDAFGWSVALSGNTAVVGADGKNTTAGVDAGNAYIFTRSGSTWSQQAKLAAGSAQANARFGVAVAIDGEAVLIGADRENNYGAVYLYERSGTTWAQKWRGQSPYNSFGADPSLGYAVALKGDVAFAGAYKADIAYAGEDAGCGFFFNRNIGMLIGSREFPLVDADQGNGLGFALAMAGETVLVGSPGDSTAKASSTGTVQVFVRSSGAWGWQGQLTSPVAASNTNFGVSLAMDGDTALVGIRHEQSWGGAHVFTRTGGVWSWQARLKVGIAPDYQNASVALDGDTAIVGVPNDYSMLGNVLVFTRSEGIWSQEAILDPVGHGWFSGRYGAAVALEGNTALVGAPAYLGSSGGVQVFTRSGNNWTQQATLLAPDGASSDYFGFSIALSRDIALIGAPYDDTAAGTDAGSAHVFSRSGTNWAWQGMLQASNAAAQHRFGESVSLSLGGDLALVGAPASGPSIAPGSAHVFARNGTGWAWQAVLTQADGVNDDSFGRAVALDGDTALVGAPYDDIIFPATGEEIKFHGSFSLFHLSYSRLEVRGNGLAIAGADTTPDSADHTHFGLMTHGTLPVSRTFTLKSVGDQALGLTGTPLVAVSGSPRFVISEQPTTAALAANGGETSFTVTYTPDVPGTHTATVSVANNSTFHRPHTFVIDALSLTHLEAWRQTHFGSHQNTGRGGNAFDDDGDGQPNLLEWALGSHPRQNGLAQHAFSLPTAGSYLEFRYSRSILARQDGTSCAVQWSDSLLSGDWHGTGVTEEILSDNGTIQEVKALVPKGEGTRRFMRLQVTPAP